MSDQGAEQPDDDVGHNDHDEQADDDEQRQRSLKAREALRVAVQQRAAAPSGGSATLPPGVLASMTPALDALRRLGLGSAAFQSPALSVLKQQTDIIAKLAMPHMGAITRLGLGASMSPALDAATRLGLGSAAFQSPALSVLKQQTDIIAKLAMPQLPWMSQKFDFAAVMPHLATTAFLPQLDIASSILGKFDVTSFLPRLGFPGFSDLLESLRKDEPPNWAGVDVDLDVVTTIIRDDGIPLVWVPRAEILEDLLEADDREARVAVLLARIDDLVEDCRDVLEDVDDQSLAGQKPLAVNAVDSLADGHFEAAQALAVTVTETAVMRSLKGSYKQVKTQVLFDPDLVPWTQLRLRAALAPIASFFTPWRPSDGVPAPAALSRHVSVHQANVEHYSQGNAVIAVLLVVSVLRALQELQAIAAASSGDEEDVA